MILLRPICWLFGHKRGRLLQEANEAVPYRYFRCPRCGNERRYKVKPK